MALVKKIDIHTHLYEISQMPRPGSGDTYCNPGQLLSMYEKLGIERGVVLPEVNPECLLGVQSNEDILRIVAMYPDRFSWFCNIDPRAMANAPDADFSYMIRYYKERGAKGVGEICAHLYFDDPRVLNLFKHCEMNDMPVIFHMSLQNGGDYGLIDDLGLVRFEKCLQMFPNLKFLGHSQAFWAHMSADITKESSRGYPTGKVTDGRIAQLMRKYPNLCGDMSAGSGYNAFARDEEYACAFMEEFQDQLYFGTDICSQFNDMKLSHWLDELVTAGKISQTVYEKISRTNAEKLLGL